MFAIIIKDYENAGTGDELYRIPIKIDASEYSRRLVHEFAMETSKRLVRRFEKIESPVITEVYCGMAGDEPPGQLIIYIRFTRSFVDERLVKGRTTAKWKNVKITPEEVEEFVNAIANEFGVPGTADAR